MYKKQLISFLLIINNFIALTQEPIYYNNIYNPNNTYASGRGILQIGDYYYGIFGTLETSGYWYNLGVFKMGLSGNLIDWKLVGENGFDYFAGSVGGTLIETIDGSLAFACHIGAPGPTIGTLVKLNLELDTVWQKMYQIGEQNTMTIKAKETNNGGYILVGQVYPGTGSYFDALMIKTDDQGNVLWYNTFGVGSDAMEYGTDIIETPDGGYLIGGMKNILTIDHSLDAMLIKTDSLGNEEWTQTYGNPDVDDDMAHVALADDGNYLVATTYGKNIISPEARTAIPYLIKVDEEGNTIWEKSIGPHRLSLFMKNFRKESDDFILTGFSSETDTATYQYYSGWVMKLDNNLDSVWYRDYVHNVNDWDNMFYDASPTSDNGYIAIGQARPDMGGSTNKMWVVKIDSMGCDTPGCATGVWEVELPEIKGGELTVWPNPTNSKVTLNLSKCELREGNKIIRIYNSLGLKVNEVKVPEHAESIEINVSKYKNGLYYIQLISYGQAIGTLKFIKNGG